MPEWACSVRRLKYVEDDDVQRAADGNFERQNMRIARNNARNAHNALDTINHARTSDGTLQRKHGALSLEFGHVAW